MRSAAVVRGANPMAGEVTAMAELKAESAALVKAAARSAGVGAAAEVELVSRDRSSSLLAIGSLAPLLA